MEGECPDRLARRYTDVSECKQSSVEEEHYAQEHEERPKRRECDTDLCGWKTVSRTGMRVGSTGHRLCASESHIV